MNPMKMKATSEAKILGKAEATWEIVDWTGPLSHLMRTNAECIVNVPSTDGDTTPDIKLRFHLKPYHGHKEPQQKYCAKQQAYVKIWTSCNCITCKDIPAESLFRVPLEFFPDTRTRSSGYSLLVDILSGPQKLALVVTVDKLNGKNWFGRKDNLVNVNPDSGYKNFPVVDNLWREIKWTEGQDGEMVRWRYTSPDDVKDVQFQLKVTAYQVDTKAANILDTLVEETAKAEKTENFPELVVEVLPSGRYCITEKGASTAKNLEGMLPKLEALEAAVEKSAPFDSTDKPAATVSTMSTTPEAEVQASSSAQAIEVLEPSSSTPAETSAKNSGLDGKENDAEPQDSDSDASLDSFCVLEKTTDGEPKESDEMKKLRAGLADLLEQFKQLKKHSG